MGRLILFIGGVALFLLTVHIDLCGWRWFAVPLGLPDLVFWHMAGLGVLLHALKGGASSHSVDDLCKRTDVDEEEDLALNVKRLFYRTLLWLIMWGMLWVLHLCNQANVWGWNG